MDTPAAFLFTTCQFGAEAALKGELAREWPAFHLAFSRPGFVTFKLPPGHALAADFDLRSVFARAYGFSLGKLTDDDADELARKAWQLAGEMPIDALHVWQRDTATPGFHGFEPGITPLAELAREALMKRMPNGLTCGRRIPSPTNPAERASGERIRLPQPSLAAPRGALVLDCVLVEPNEWWIGYHRTDSVASRWPGGMLDIELPPHAVSRAYLKMEESLRWSRLPVETGTSCAEIGCAPGGASQALLDRGATVLGIDPAEVDPAVLAHPRFRHARKRSKDLRRREFAGVDVLVADMNVAPNYTLDAVEAIVTHPTVKITGLLLTLKLMQWELAREIPAYLDRVRSWGYRHVQARQLQHNRQEICVAAQREGR